MPDPAIAMHASIFRLREHPMYDSPRVADVRLARPDFRETMRDFILMCLDRYC